MLKVDLGGNDLHADTAGGAAVLPTISVSIDLVGDDTYAITQDHENADVDGLVAQGAGLIGIGVLVDYAGADTYTASADMTGSPGFTQTQSPL